MTRKNTSHGSLVLVDVENLLGTGDPCEQAVVQIHQDLLDILGDTRDTLFEVACSHHAATAVAFGFPSGRHHWRSGPNGADLALLEVMESEGVHSRFDQIVVASGDGIFAPAVSALSHRGVRCTVISRRASLSARLCLAASATTYLDDLLTEGGEADAA